MLKPQLPEAGDRGAFLSPAPSLPPGGCRARAQGTSRAKIHFLTSQCFQSATAALFLTCTQSCSWVLPETPAQTRGLRWAAGCSQDPKDPLLGWGEKVNPVQGTEGFCSSLTRGRLLVPECELGWGCDLRAGPVTPAAPGSAQAPRAGAEGAGSEPEPSSGDAQAGGGGETDFSSIPFPLRNASRPLASRRGSATSRHSTVAFNVKGRAEQTLSQQEEGAPAAATAQTLLSPLHPRPPMGHMSWPCSGRDHAAAAPLSAAPAAPSCPCILLETLWAQGTRARLAGDRAVLPGDLADVRLGRTGASPLHPLSAR